MNQSGITKEKLGVSRKELASALSVDASSISSWFIKRQRPKLYLRQLKALMQVTGMDIDSLIEALDPEDEIVIQPEQHSEPIIKTESGLSILSRE